jgi:hypothetical protein
MNGPTRIQVGLQRLAAAHSSQTLRHWFVTQYKNAMKVLSALSLLLVSFISDFYIYVILNLQSYQVSSYRLKFDLSRNRYSSY